MSQDDILRSMPDLPRLVEAWETIGLDEASQDRLTDLLRSSREARKYFLEHCQIDAELRWRFASQAQVTGTLARQEAGTIRPIAAIVLSGLGFRDDAGFPAVFEKVEESEPHAQQWLQIYMVLRACLLMGFPRLCDAEATVNSICERLAAHPLTTLTPERFRQLASDEACRAVGRRLAGNRGSVARNLNSIIERCLHNSQDIDAVAVYESFEASVPRHVPSDTLRLLCMRYLLELSPAEIASSLGLPEPTVRARLAEARLQIWKSCVRQVNLCDVPAELEGLSALNRALDQPGMSEPSIAAAHRRTLPEHLWRELDAWIEGSDERRRSFVTFAILHESLYRRLSLNHLLEESKTRRDEQFHQVVGDMVLHLENASESVSRVPDPPRRTDRSRAPAAWAAAIAAALLMAASAGIWWSNRAPANRLGDQPVARQAPAASEPANDPRPADPPPRTVVAEVTAALDADGPGGQAFETGSPIYADEPIELAAGILHLSTASGSEWVLEGPVSVVLKDGGEMSLVRGKVVGLNSSHAESLLVHTPTARVLDTGTEFGVSVGDRGTTSVAVYDGAVELSTATEGSPRAATRALNIEADFEATVREDGLLPTNVERLLHDRAFIRPDEVELRQQRRQGSAAAAEKVAFYELLRVDGLLAYQGFHSPSKGSAFSVGFLPPRGQVPLQFADDLASSHSSRRSSSALLLSNDSTVFLDLDVSDRSPLARAGLLDHAGFLGASEADLWLCWRSKSSLPLNRHFKWTGLSLMYGDERRIHEPVFIGQPADSASFGLQNFTDDQVFIRELDAKPNVPEIQTIASDNRPHLWIARVAIHGTGSSTVSVWCDVHPSDVDSTPAQAEQQIEDLRFDRLRVEVSQEGDNGWCAYDEVILTTSREALVEAMAVHTPQPTR